MKAIFSDVHANLEALQAVLDDIAHHPVMAVYCLGDTVGYGPNPRECLDLVRQRCQVALLGNHGEAVLLDPLARVFTSAARRAVLWTREQLQAPVPDRQAADRRWEFLEGRPRRHQEGDLLFVHASPCDPLHEYVFPEDAWDQDKLGRLFAAVERHCFQGHTHLPGVFRASPYEFQSPAEVGEVCRLGGRKAMVNVGSVGQPRDGDPRACYVLLDGDTVRFRRVPYDVKATAGKMEAIPALRGWLAGRLLAGR